MKTRDEYGNSRLRQIIDLLFSDNFTLPFAESFVGKILTKFSFPALAPLFLLGAAGLLWYERWLEQSLPVLGADFLPILFVTLSFLFAEKKGLIVRKYHLWGLAFLIASAGAGFLGALLSFGSWNILIGLTLPVLFMLSLLSGEAVKSNCLKNGLFLLAVPLLLNGLLEKLSGAGTRYSYLETAGQRTDSLIGNPNIFGFILVIVMLLGIDAWIKLNRRQKIISTPGFMLLIYVLLTTGSRSAWLALLIGAAVFVLLKNKKLLLAALALPLVALNDRVRERILTALSPQYQFDAAIDGRIWATSNALHLFKKFPFGTGPGTYGNSLAQGYSSPVYLEGLQNGYPALLTTDNQYLSVLVQTGILGILSFLGFLVALLSALVARRIALGCSLLAAFAVMMAFSNAFDFGAVAVPLGFLLGQSLTDEVK